MPGYGTGKRTPPLEGSVLAKLIQQANPHL